MSSAKRRTEPFLELGSREVGEERSISAAVGTARPPCLRIYCRSRLARPDAVLLGISMRRHPGWAFASTSGDGSKTKGSTDAARHRFHVAHGHALRRERDRRIRSSVHQETWAADRVNAGRFVRGRALMEKDLGVGNCRRARAPRPRRLIEPGGNRSRPIRPGRLRISRVHRLHGYSWPSACDRFEAEDLARRLPVSMKISSRKRRRSRLCRERREAP